jgi:hypothetical protein
MIHFPNEDENLVRLYQKDSSARVVLDYFETMSVWDTEVDVSQIVSEKNYPRQGVIDFFKKLEMWNYGEFVIGRRGHDSRFRFCFRLSPQAIAHAAKRAFQGDVGTSDGTEIPKSGGESANLGGSNEVSSSHSGLTHRFLLRPDYAVNIELPLDLTNSEATRLADFVKSLLFG